MREPAIRPRPRAAFEMNGCQNQAVPLTFAGLFRRLSRNPFRGDLVSRSPVSAQRLADRELWRSRNDRKTDYYCCLRSDNFKLRCSKRWSLRCRPNYRTEPCQQGRSRTSTAGARAGLSGAGTDRRNDGSAPWFFGDGHGSIGDYAAARRNASKDRD